MLSSEQLKTLRARLESERDRLQAELADIGHGDEGNLSFDQNFADSSQVTAERGELDALAVSLIDAFSHVKDALGKMDAGTYGICEVCGGEITFDRLDARPEARRCISCASKA